MSARWEYLTVSSTYSTNFDTKSPGEAQTWASTLWIERPGQEVEKRDGDGLKWGRFLNELGAEGWELVAERATQNVVVASSYGWRDVARPVVTWWTFKRPVE